MKIATWNLQRPKSPKTYSGKNAAISEKLREVGADVLILTETNECIDLGPDYAGYPSNEPKHCKECDYTKGENRITIWVNKKYAAQKRSVSDTSTSVCVNVTTELGELLVYGTIIGILGHPSQNLDEQIRDWRTASRNGELNICIAGDFNVQFCRSDNFTNGSKEKILDCFEELGITNLTWGIAENIDHIAITNQFLAKASHSEAHIWNLGAWKVKQKFRAKQLSDHIGVSVKLNIEKQTKLY